MLHFTMLPSDDRYVKFVLISAEMLKFCCFMLDVIFEMVTCGELVSEEMKFCLGEYADSLP